MLETGARRGPAGRDSRVRGLPPDALRTFQRVALLGLAFTHRRATGRGGCVARTRPTTQLEPAVAARVVEPAEARLPLPASPSSGRRCCERWPRTAVQRARGASRSARDPRRAARRGSPTSSWPPACLRGRCPTRCRPWRPPAPSVPTATPSPWWTASASTPAREHRPALLARRGDLLMALGDPGAVAAYRARRFASRPAPSTGWSAPGWRGPRPFAGDLATARSALTGLELEDDEADASAAPRAGQAGLLRRGHRRRRGRSRPRPATTSLSADDPWHVVDLVGAAGSVRPPPRGVVRAASARAATDAGTRPLAARAVRRPPLRRGVPALRSDARTRRSSPRPSSCGAAPTRPARCAGSPSPPP